MSTAKPITSSRYHGTMGIASLNPSYEYYPTLAECYKVAAFDGINRLGMYHEDIGEISDEPEPEAEAETAQ